MADYSDGSTRIRSQQYFATLDGEELGHALMDKIDNYYDYTRTTGLRNMWIKSYECFYRALEHEGNTYSTGEEEEYEVLHVNHYRNLLRHVLITVTSPRPQFEPRATNTDLKSQAQTVVTRSLLDYYLKEKRVGKNAVTAVEHALVFGEGFITTGWDEELGEEIILSDEEREKLEHGEQEDLEDSEGKTGDMFFNNHTPMDVIRDFLKEDNNHEWYIIRSFRNRFDLAAQYEERADDILNVPTRSEELEVERTRSRYLYKSRGYSDDIPIYTLYHKRNRSLPEGRMVEFLGSEIILLDTPLPYKKSPVYRVSASDIMLSCFGYTDGFDLLNVQEAIDTLYSTILTNNAAFGVQSVVAHSNSNLKISQVSEGMKIVTYDGEAPPKAFQLTQTAPETFKFLDLLEKQLETLSGVNSVSRGNPGASLESGAALALVQAQTLQFLMDLQRSYVELLEDLGTAIININKVFAESRRTIAIVGKNNRSNLRSFTGKDISNIDRVTVDVGNPLTNSRAGQINLAEKMLESGLIKRPEEYISIIETGRHEPMIEHEMNELLSIRSENELLRDAKFARDPKTGENLTKVVIDDATGQPAINPATGKPQVRFLFENEVVTLAVDDHRLHVLEHKGVLSDPFVRNNPEVVAAVTQHIQDHIREAQSMDPQLVAMLGYAPAAPPESSAGPKGPGNLSNALSASNPLEVAAGKVNLPNMPRNPLTNQKWDPETGGLPNVGLAQ